MCCVIRRRRRRRVHTQARGLTSAVRVDFVIPFDATPKATDV
jgi:hypothetical protein